MFDYKQDIVDFGISTSAITKANKFCLSLFLPEYLIWK